MGWGGGGTDPVIQEDRGDFQNKKKSCVIRKQSYTRSIYRRFEKSLRDPATKGKLAGARGDKYNLVCVACGGYAAAAYRPPSLIQNRQP